MTLAATTNWLAAAGHAATIAEGSASYAPILLADFLALNRTFATCDPGFTLVETVIEQIEKQGLAAITYTMDEITDDVRISGAGFTLLNQDMLSSTFTTELLNTPIRLRLGFVGLAESDYLTIFTGVLDRYRKTWEHIECSVVDTTIQRSVVVSQTVGPQYFPNAPSDSQSKRIPLVLGTVDNAPCIVLTSSATSTLGLAMTAADTACSLVDAGANFPPSGAITIEQETGITYSGRSVTAIAGVAYLQLTGLVRTAPGAHTTGAQVQLEITSQDWLVGYEVASIRAVKDAGILVPATDYTVQTLQADRPVTVLRFSTPRLAVTANVDAATTNTTNLLTNGGFETGDDTGWTTSGATLDVGTGQPAGGELTTNGGFETGDNTGWTEDGGTLTVGTSAPPPAAGTYRGALEGGVGSFGDIYQDIATSVGNLYAWSFWYQNEVSTPSNLLTNGDFEDGDLTGWTVNATSSSGSAGATVFTGVPVAAGTYAVECAPANIYGISGAVNTYVVDLVQDVSTTIGLTYEIRVQYTSYSVSSGGGASGSPFSYTWSRASVAAGTTTAPESMLPLTALGTTRYAPYYASQGFSLNWQAVAGVRFVATDTTTRVTFRADGQALYIIQSPVQWDSLEVRLIDDQALAAYEIGTPSLEGVYNTGTLAQVAQWAQASGTFAATDTTMRFRLRSQSATTPLNTFFDLVSLRATVSYDVLPYAGAYRAALTGGAGSYGDAYQDVTTVIGQRYRLDFVYRDALDQTGNLVVNGSFESGSMLGWQSSLGAHSQWRVFNLNVQYGQDGQYIAFLSYAGPSPVVDASYSGMLWQDIPVSPGTDYTLSWRYQAGTDVGLGSQRSINSVSTLRYKIGTPTQDDLYVPLTAAPDHGAYPMASVTVTVTSADTMLRLTLVISSVAGVLGASNSGIGYALDAAVDAFTCSTSTPPSDQAAYQLGTPGTPGLYADVALTQVYTWTLISLAFVATTTATRLTLRSQSPGGTLASYFDACSIIGGQGGLNPVEVIRYVISTWDPTALIDATSFNDAEGVLTPWSFGGSSFVADDLRVLLQRLARQCGTLIMKDNLNQYTLTPLFATQSPSFDFLPSNVWQQSLAAESSPVDSTYTEFFVYYGAKTGGNSSAGDFASVVYATPTGTSLVADLTLQQLCQTSQAIYGKDQRLDAFAEWIQDTYTADLYLNWLVNRYAVSAERWSWRTWMDAMPLHLGQRVTLTHPLVPSGATITGELVESSFDPQTMNVGLTMRAPTALPALTLPTLMDSWFISRAPAITTNARYSRFYIITSLVEFSGKLYAGGRELLGPVSPDGSGNTIVTYDASSGWQRTFDFSLSGGYLADRPYLAAMSGTLYAVVENAAIPPATAAELWHFNGSAWSFNLVLPSGITGDYSISGNQVGAGIQSICPYQGNLYIVRNGQAGTGTTVAVYVTDGSSSGVSHDFATSSANYRNPQRLIEYQGNLYCTFDDKLYMFDGATWALAHQFGSRQGYTIASIAYAALTLTGGATPLVLGYNSWTSPIALPFTVNFYGVACTQLRVSSNGFLSFELVSGTTYIFDPLPNGYALGVVAAFATSLDPTAGGSAQYEVLGTSPNRIFVLEFVDVPRDGASSADVTFQIHVHETTGIIEMHVLAADTAPDDYTTTQGLSSISGTLADVVAGRNATYFSLANDAQRFTPNPYAPGLLFTVQDGEGIWALGGDNGGANLFALVKTNSQLDGGLYERADNELWMFNGTSWLYRGLVQKGRNFVTDAALLDLGQSLLIVYTAYNRSDIANPGGAAEVWQYFYATGALIQVADATTFGCNGDSRNEIAGLVRYSVSGQVTLGLTLDNLFTDVFTALAVDQNATVPAPIAHNNSFHLGNVVSTSFGVLTIVRSPYNLCMDFVSFDLDQGTAGYQHTLTVADAHGSGQSMDFAYDPSTAILTMTPNPYPWVISAGTAASWSVTYTMKDELGQVSNPETITWLHP